MTAEYQVSNRTGYDPGDADFHDINALHERFGIDLPGQFASR
jgi:hypothetical protein